MPGPCAARTVPFRPGSPPRRRISPSCRHRPAASGCCPQSPVGQRVQWRQRGTRGCLCVCARVSGGRGRRPVAALTFRRFRRSSAASSGSATSCFGICQSGGRRGRGGGEAGDEVRPAVERGHRGEKQTYGRDVFDLPLGGLAQQLLGRELHGRGVLVLHLRVGEWCVCVWRVSERG